MDFLSTKTQAEREDDEAERLVRPAPKLKPPRRDLRRERDESDHDVDPDEAADRKDRSDNYKNVGGSAQRVVAKYLQAVEFPTEEAKQEYLKSHPEADPSKHTVKSEEEQAAVEEKKKPRGKGKKEKKPRGKGKKEEKPSGFKPPTAPKRENYDSDEEYQESLEQHKAKLQKHQEQLQAKAQEPKPKRKDFESEEDFEAAVAEHKKAIQEAESALKGTPKKEPEEVEDVTEAVPKVPPPQRPPASRAQREAAIRKILDVFPKESRVALIQANLHPDDVDDLVKYYEAVASKPEKNITAFAGRVGKFYETDPSKVPLPETIQTKKGDFVSFAALSPQDQAEVYRAHQIKIVAISLAAKKNIQDSLSKTLPKGTDPMVAVGLTQVLLKPPGEGRSAVSQQAADMVFDRATSQTGVHVPPKAAKKLVESLSGNPDAQRIVVAYLQGNDLNTARNLFIAKGPTGWGAFKKGLGTAVSIAATPAKVLWSLLKDDDDDDYDREEKEGVVDDFQDISEWSSPKDIGKGIQSAQNFMKIRARNYPSELASERDPRDTFKRMVLHRIETLAPQKAAPTKLYLEHQEIADYDRDQANHEQELAEWEIEVEHQLDQGPEPKKPDQAKYSTPEAWQEAMRSYNGLLEDRQAALWTLEQKNPKPVPPVKPAHYDRVKNPKATRDLRKWLLTEQFAQYGEKTAARVAARFVISSYPTPSSMAPVSEKAAVYNGVAPAEYPGYNGWQQPAQRDFGETDWEMILGAAKDWLQTPVLKQSLPGIVRDTQLRAALDLAIYSGPYNGAIQPNNYNMLLARLAGVDGNMTLLTQRQATDSPLGDQGSQKVANMKASNEIRKLAAKYAAENAPLAYDLMDLATRVAQDEEQDQDQGQKQAQDQGQDDQDQGEKQAKKYASLRAAVISAAQQNPEARAAFMPVLQAVKSLDV